LKDLLASSDGGGLSLALADSGCCTNHHTMHFSTP
jgi:hypothetical protein